GQTVARATDAHEPTGDQAQDVEFQAETSRAVSAAQTAGQLSAGGGRAATACHRIAAPAASSAGDRTYGACSTDASPYLKSIGSRSATRLKKRLCRSRGARQLLAWHNVGYGYASARRTCDWQE